MAKYIRICPACGHSNEERAATCVMCDEFLGLVEAIPAPDAPEETPPVKEPAPERPQGAIPLDVPVTQRFGQAPVLLVQAVGSEKATRVGDGDVVGRSSEGGQAADMQLDGIDGVEFVHSRHCRFDFRQGAWHCTALDEGSFSPPNPTYVNERLVPPGGSRRVRDGDRVRLSGVVLEVRFP